MVEKEGSITFERGRKRITPITSARGSRAPLRQGCNPSLAVFAPLKALKLLLENIRTHRRFQTSHPLRVNPALVSYVGLLVTLALMIGGEFSEIIDVSSQAELFNTISNLGDNVGSSKTN